MTTLDTPIGPRVLHQASIWRSYDDRGQLRTLFLEEMTPAHRLRVLTWLREHAAALHEMEKAYVGQMWRQRRISDADFAYGMVALAAVSPEQWVEEQALVRRLRQLGARPAGLRRRGLLRRLARR